MGMICTLKGMICRLLFLSQYLALKLEHVVKVKLDLCLNTTIWRHIGGVDVGHHTFLNLGSRWMWVVSFALRLPYTWEKSPRRPPVRRWVSLRPQNYNSLSEVGSRTYCNRCENNSMFVYINTCRSRSPQRSLIHHSVRGKHYVGKPQWRHFRIRESKWHRYSKVISK